MNRVVQFLCLGISSLMIGVAGVEGASTQPTTLPSVSTPVEVKYSPPTHTTMLGTTFVDWDSLVPKYTPVGQLRSVFDDPTPTLEKLEMHITTLRPGMVSHAIHHHPWEEMLLIKEGDVEVSINGQKYGAGPGYLIFYASHDPHNIKNVGKTDATYYVINFYTSLLHTVPDKPAIQQAVPGMLASGVIDCNSLTPTPTPTGSRVSVLDSPTLTFQRLSVHITTLNAGQSTRVDMVDPGDEIFIIKSGEMQATINGVTSRMKEGSLFYCAPNDKRTFKNIGATPATYQVFKVVTEKSPK